ncbi:YccS family putative transporter [Halotalea alkalilenta]|uniref:Uncharacterized protein n=1 Tax=Halotalea alkalilenta TaxID=376489 RepID=A0A172YEU0_9GAMM|nr:YccS family putative transporter [Halotalea alkalilenta]ANF57791.1 hypothetical protein A5892_10215 [Halotalea alkalilenta]
MPLPSPVASLRRLWTLDKFAPSARVFVALVGALGFSLWQGEPAHMVALFLGIIACALAETDDGWRGRLRALAFTLACFTIAAFAVELLFPYPLLFALGLGATAFSLTLLGALGARYATICTATLILAIYTMISVEQRGVVFDALWREPLALVSGAAWYGLVSVLWQVCFAHQPVKLRMVRVLKLLGDYLVLKASLFEPVRGVDLEARRIELARQNARVVEALNLAKEALFSRLQGRRPDGRLSRYLRLYFIIQDLHERATSTHYPYAALTEAFFHSDVLFRCQRLLSRQGVACRGLGQAMLMRRHFDHRESEQALEDLRASLDQLGSGSDPSQRGLLRSLDALARNLTELERQLALADNPEALDAAHDPSLFDRSPQGLRDGWERVRMQLTPRSEIFRHACRLSAALVAGYGALHLIHPTQGYWILLTTLFVCRPSYGATLRTLRQRVVGTIIGLLVGWASITLFPAPMLQAILAVAAGVVFFATRENRYTLATAAITLLVLCCFNQIGDGFGLILPRLLDTLLGAGLAGLAVLLVLPDWRGRSLERQAATSLERAAGYLGEIVHQFQSGRRDDLAYRLARRDAHNADAAFSALLGNILLEPQRHRSEAEPALRFLIQSHSLLGHLSALGAHRDRIRISTEHDPLATTASEIVQALEAIAAGLRGSGERRWLSACERRQPAVSEESVGEENDARRLAITQLELIQALLVPLDDAARKLVADA